MAKALSKLWRPILLVLVIGSNASVLAQQTGLYPPYTLTIQNTAYNSNDEVLLSSVHTAYHAASGDWRVTTTTGTDETATVYRRGRGVYFSTSRTSLLIKVSNHAPGCPLRTAEQLRSDPRFVRTENVLGFVAYVWNENLNGGYWIETYWIPDLGGGTPIKRLTVLKDGRKFLEEPLSIKLGEPSAFDLSGPSYKVIEDPPTFNKRLEEQIRSQPDPVYDRSRSDRYLPYKITVSVIVDEDGRVIHASSNTLMPFLTAAVVEAAYQATFSPTIHGGRPVVSSGLLIYHFS